MDFNQILKELKEALFQVTAERYGSLTKESKKDIDVFLEASKDKLERWTILFATNELSKTDYEWLVQSQKDLLEMKGLEQAGISKISLGHFKNKVVNTITEVVIGLIL